MFLPAQLVEQIPMLMKLHYQAVFIFIKIKQRFAAISLVQIAYFCG
jgi:hypothetical protein